VPLVMFGGTRASVAVPVGLSAIACAIVLHPRLNGWLDAALLLVTGSIAVQLVPLPSAAIAVLSPHAQYTRDALTLVTARPAAVGPLSMRGPQTEWALVVFGGAIALFFLARATFARGGVRRTVWGIAAIGYALSGLAIAQAATAGRSIYWLFPTEYEGPLPFGPFVNRNHFATWAIMALPLTVGYLMSRSPSRAHAHAPDPGGRGRVTVDVDSRGAWMTAASVLMLLALLLSLSRSGIVALIVAAGVTVLGMRRRLRRDGQWVVAGVVGALMFAAVAWSDVPGLADRLSATSTGVLGRVTIWRETMPVVRDFWLTGTGAGTYQTAMLVYQQSDRRLFFNQAHNHYLQVAAEGGLLLTVAVTIALVAFIVAAAGAIRRDTSNVRWTRAGAACGLGAVMLQSLWETGLVMPANAMLAAILAAILLHERQRSDGSRVRSHRSDTADERIRHAHAGSDPFVHARRSTRTTTPR